MRKLNLILILLLTFIIAKGQNPFEEYGFEVEYATLSQGVFDEEHDKHYTTEIAGIIFDTRNNKIICKVDYGNVDNTNPEISSRFISMDPLAEKYYHISPYAYCANNPINYIDPDGRDWYRNNESGYYTWYEGDQARDGYSYVGGQGSVLGEFESIINNLLTQTFKVNGLYSEGFTFDIVKNDKGALIGSKEGGWDFFDEFINGTGPEFSVFLSDHPYTEAMKNDKGVLEAHQQIFGGNTDVPGQITSYRRDWGAWDVLTSPSMAKQFIGSYRFDAFTSKNGKSLNNVISDSKSMSSFLYHLYPGSKNPSRSQQKIMGTTYQFYIWQSPKK